MNDGELIIELRKIHDLHPGDVPVQFVLQEVIARLTPKKQYLTLDGFLEAIDFLTRARGYPPSHRELMQYLDLRTTSAVSYWCSVGKRDGRLDFDPGKSRTIRLVNRE